MRILLTFLHPDPSGLALARRSVSYDQMVILATSAQIPQARKVLGEELRTTDLEQLRPKIIQVDAEDPDATLAIIEKFLDHAPTDEITFNIAAQDPSLTYVAFLACLRLGHEAQFFIHDRTAQLPVMRGLRLVETFSPAEMELCLRLHRDPRVTPAGAGSRQIVLDRTLSALRQKGVVRLVQSPDGLKATFTSEGTYYVEQLLELASRQTVARAAPISTSVPAKVKGAASRSRPGPNEAVRLLKPDTLQPWGKSILSRPRVERRRMPAARPSGGSP